MPESRPRTLRAATTVAGGVVALVVAGIGALTVAGFAGAWAWVFDLASSFRPQYAATLLLAAAGLIGLGWLRAALAAVVLALVNLVVVAPLWVAPPAVVDNAAPTLRVLWHNVHGVGEDNTEALARSITIADVDVVLLGNASGRLADELAGLLSPYDVVDAGAADGSLAVVGLARVPVRAVDPVDLGDRSRLGLALTADLGPRTVHMLAIHPRSPRTPERARARDAQLEAAGEWAGEQAGATLVVGDFNATPWSHGFRRVANAGGLHSSQAGFGLQPTWAAGTGPLMVPIDHALHGDGLTTVDRRTGPALGSAHRSLIVELAFTPKRTHTAQP